MEILNFIKENKNWQELLSNPPFIITVKWDEPYFLLKYNQIESDFSNPLVRECRGSIFKYENGEYSCVCMPFYKFGNYGESYVKPLDWDSTFVLEKVDGSIVKLWFDDEWHWSTNNVIDARKAVINNANFDSFFGLIKEAVKGDFSFLSLLDKNNCYMFELASPFNKVVVPYHDTSLYLIGVRNMVTMNEYGFEYLDNLYQEKLKYFNFKIPNRYNFTNLNDCIDATKKMGSDEEGFVAVDRNFNRVKIKSLCWLEAAKLKNNGVITGERVITMMREGTIDDFLSYCPEHQDFIGEIVTKYITFSLNLNQRALILDLEGSFNLSRPEFARIIKEDQSLVKPFLFKKYTNNSFTSKEYIDSIPAKKLAHFLMEEFLK